MKRIITILSTILCVLTVAARPDGLTIHYLGANNTLVRVDEPRRYLLLPVEEDAPDATINVLADNRCDRVLTVRLAINRVDYFVPFELQPYADRSLVLDIRTGNSRANVRDAMDDACWEEIRLSDTFDTANRERFRPLYHHTPQWGWMNASAMRPQASVICRLARCPKWSLCGASRANTTRSRLRPNRWKGVWRRPKVRVKSKWSLRRALPERYTSA